MRCEHTLTVSTLLILCEWPIFDLHLRRLVTRSPGRVLVYCLSRCSCLSLCIPANSHNTVEVHSVNSNTRVVLDTEIDVLRDTKSKVASLREVALAELVLLDLEATLEDLLCLGPTDSDVDSNLLVTTDTECTDSVAGLAYEENVVLKSRSLLLISCAPALRRTVDGCLTAQLLEHLCGTSKSVTRLADGDVEDELLDFQLPHGVLAFLA